MALSTVISLGLPDLFRALDLTGVLVNGVLGGLIARKKRFDAMGFAFLAVISALGGGMLRDVLLQHGTPVALTDPLYIVTALAGAALAFVARFDRRWWNRSFILADALVLGCWAATGAAKTLSVGLGWVPALMLGTLTAVGGGMIRDISVGQVPAVFGGTTLYGTAALAGASVMVLMHPHFSSNISMLVATGVGFALCVTARWRRWRLPEHDDWSITLTSTQLRRLMRIRVRRGPRGMAAALGGSVDRPGRSVPSGERMSDDDEGPAPPSEGAGPPRLIR
ncbi:MAG: trimeric intracellular cation channel family protein [Bowdeniella nasicola]|nr:trimeric intracellular cation channel family protein [Bowdeniella nasicola]